MATRETNEVGRLSVSAHLVDARGKPCPVPIIELAGALGASPLVELWATDPAARGDLEAFAGATGHGLLQLDTSAGFLRAVVQRK